MKILNLGSLNFDRFYEVPHFVTEGESILSQSYAESLGGKGLNQSLALAKAGANVYHAGAIGYDGGQFRTCLENAGVHTQYLLRSESVSGHAIIQKCRGQNCIIVHGGANQLVTQTYISEVLTGFDTGDLLLLQNETSNVSYAISEAKARGLTVAFNASPITSEMMNYPLDLVDYFLINEVEGKALSETQSEDYEQILSALAERFPHAAIILTIGSGGVLYQDRHIRTRHKSYCVPVVDTTAAGDTFCGYFLASLAGENSISNCLKMASMAAAIAVSRNGASDSIPTMEEVLAFAKEND